MNLSLSVHPQITIQGLYDAIRARSLDVAAFVKAVRPILPYVPDIPDDAETVLVRGLHEVELPELGTVQELFAPYRELGVPREWDQVIAALRIRDRPQWTVLVHPEVVGGGDYVIDYTKPADVVTLQRVPVGDGAVVRPVARTLGVTLDLGIWDRMPLAPPQATPDALLFELAEAVADLVRPTLGGPEYLAPDPDGRALAVLAATVAAFLGHPSCQRTPNRERIVRSDAYRAIFEALELGHLFEAGRRLLERGHDQHAVAHGPFPPGEEADLGDLAVLNYQNGFLTLNPEASRRLRRSQSSQSVGLRQAG
jgi:hypothetical protein